MFEVTCSHCSADHETRCHDCGDLLCESHALAIPGYQTLVACSDCLAKRAAVALGDYVRELHAVEFLLGGRAA